MQSAAPIRYQVFVLCYNRPAETLEAVQSWLAQDLSNTELIVSDNSTNDETQSLLSQHFPTLQIRRRRPSQRSLEHFNLCLAEATADWIFLFHDDDMMLPNGFASYRENAIRHPLAAAIAGNSFYMRGTTLTSEKLNSRLVSDRILATPAELVQGYLQPVSSIQPLPAYMYRRAAIEGVRFGSRGGKYHDVVFLIEVAARGEIVWLAEPVMVSRIHAGSDSAAHDIRAALGLIRYIRSSPTLPKASSELQTYRMWNYLLHIRKIRGRVRTLMSWRNRVIALRLARYLARHPGPILNKVLNRIRFRRFN